MPSLYLIPAPIADATFGQVLPTQVIDVLTTVDVFFVENVRTTRRLIGSLKLGRVIDELTFYTLDKDTPEAETRQQLQAAMKQGRDVGVLSEAGCPGVADPGAVVVGLAHQLNIPVVPLVGPSSIILALMASGMSGQSFVFHGYLPIEKADKLRKILHLEREAQTRRQTQIFIETPFRNNHLLADVLATCQPETRVCVACNLTAPDGFVRTMTVRDWKSQKIDLHKKPTVFLLL